MTIIDYVGADGVASVWDGRQVVDLDFNADFSVPAGRFHGLGKSRHAGHEGKDSRNDDRAGDCLKDAG